MRPSDEESMPSHTPFNFGTTMRWSLCVHHNLRWTGAGIRTTNTIFRPRCVRLVVLSTPRFVVGMPMLPTHSHCEKTSPSGLLAPFVCIFSSGGTRFAPSTLLCKPLAATASLLKSSTTVWCVTSTTKQAARKSSRAPADAATRVRAAADSTLHVFA